MTDALIETGRGSDGEKGDDAQEENEKQVHGAEWREGRSKREGERNEALSRGYGQTEKPQSAAAGAGNPHARKQWSRNWPKLVLLTF